jgi:DNA-binding HxlR family transcriptional regulator
VQKIGILTDSREQKIMHIISEGGERFGDLKDKTRLHQETLSRILERLEERLVVRKDDKKYRPCCNGYELIKIMPKNKR